MQDTKDKQDVPPEFQNAIPVWNTTVEAIISERLKNEPTLIKYV